MFGKEKSTVKKVIIDGILLYLFELYINSYFESVQGKKRVIIKQTLFGISY